MDRDNRWDRVQKAYDVLTKGEGETAEMRCCCIGSFLRKGCDG